MIETIYSIGVYSSTEDTFFEALTEAKIDLFVDIRLRRGLRGKTYAYANSTFLQNKLRTLNIAYLHYQALAPTAAIKQLQEDSDKQSRTARRQRETLSPIFVDTYQSVILAQFNSDDFLKAVGDHSNICLFCVEHHPEACHRSLAAAKLSDLLQVPLKHLTP